MATNGTPEENHAAAPAVNGTTEDVDPVAPAEAKLPTRKDASLKEFLGKMDDYAPIVSFSPSPNAHNYAIISDAINLTRTPDPRCSN